MMVKKMNCGCGCVPPGKTAKRKVKTESAQEEEVESPLSPMK